MNAFDEGVVRRLAGSAVAKLDVIPVGPVVARLGGELGPIVDADLLRQGTAIDAYDRENARDIGTTEAAARHCGQALPGVGIDHSTMRVTAPMPARPITAP